MTSLNTICQNMKLKLVKMIKNFVKILELLGDRLEVCVSVVFIAFQKNGKNTRGRLELLTSMALNVHYNPHINKRALDRSPES